MRISMKDVAKSAGVSTATVSHVINKTRFVKEETKQKVIKAMGELHYHPNSAARSLRSQKSNIIALLVPDISNFFFTGIAKGIENILADKGYNLIISDSGEEIENEIKKINILNAQLIDGLIIAPTSDKHNYLNKVVENYPVVFIDRKPQGFDKGDCVLVNNITGAYEAINYLIKKGHKDIGIITGLPELTTTIERLEGYKKALEDNGIETQEHLIKVGNSMSSSGYQFTRELLSTDITALFVANNLMSIGAMKCLKEENVKIPEQLAIIGFDDHQWASMTAPPLSVVKQPIKAIGKQAAELLLSKINKESQDYKEYRLPTQLIIRKSC